MRLRARTLVVLVLVLVVVGLASLGFGSAWWVPRPAVESGREPPPAARTEPGETPVRLPTRVRLHGTITRSDGTPIAPRSMAVSFDAEDEPDRVYAAVTLRLEVEV